MRYIDNLLDWGDALFAEFTRESLNEATMLYVLAADILGPAPVPVGDCDQADRTLTYAELEKHLGTTSDFLIELELVGNRGTATEDPRALVDAMLLDDDLPAGRAMAVRAARAPALAPGPGLDGPGFDGADGPGFDGPGRAGRVGSMARCGGRPAVSRSWRCRWPTPSGRWWRTRASSRASPRAAAPCTRRRRRCSVPGRAWALARSARTR